MNATHSVLLDEIKLLGAKQKLTEIQATLEVLNSEFGTRLFPSGVPVIAQPLRVHVKDKINKAQKLIQGAERLHKKYGRKKASKGRKFSPETLAKMFPPSPNDSDRMLIGEAAEFLGRSDAAIRLWLKTGKLQSCPDTTDPRHRIQVWRADIVRLAGGRAETAETASGELVSA